MHPKLTCHCVGACCVFLQTISNGHCSRRLFWENPIKPVICCLALQRTRRCCGSSHRNWWCFSQKRVSYTWQVHPPISCVSLLHAFTCSARRSPPSDDSAVDEVCCCGRGRTGGLRQRRLGCVSDGNRQQRPLPLGPDREVRALEKLRIWRLNLKVYASYQVLVYSCLFSSSTGGRFMCDTPGNLWENCYRSISEKLCWKTPVPKRSAKLSETVKLMEKHLSSPIVTHRFTLVSAL